jgi:hypothetical protein
MSHRHYGDENIFSPQIFALFYDPYIFFQPVATQEYYASVW